jgi:hypothetical protein
MFALIMKNLTRKGEEHNFYLPQILKIREIIFFCGQITLWAISSNILPREQQETI